MVKMTLSFVTSRRTIALNQTVFTHPLLRNEVRTIRGATAPPGVGNFRWSNGVRAVSLLLVRHAVQRLKGGSHELLRQEPALLEGYDSSLAASLDYALSKQPLWLHDMFGRTPQGKPVSRLLFGRINPDRKRPGPVMVFVSHSRFEVVVEVDGRPVTCGRQLTRIVELLECVACEA